MRVFGEGLGTLVAEGSRGFLPEFRQRMPWMGADLQTLRNTFIRTQHINPVAKRILAPIAGTGQSLNVAVIKPTNEAPNNKALVLIHGLGGSEDSAYIQKTANCFAQVGWTVYCMNYRGVGPSAATSKAPYNAGLTGDLRAVLKAVEEDAEGMELYAIGFSLGGQLVLRTLGEGDVSPALKAAVSVSAPLNLANASAKLHRLRNYAYVQYLVNGMKRDLGDLAEKEFGLDRARLKSVWDFDEYIIAPAFGYENAADYHEKASCFPLLEHINIPILAIHSADDPWIPWEDYEQARWPDLPQSGAVLLPHGGHVGFHCRETKGVWFEYAAKHFFNSI